MITWQDLFGKVCDTLAILTYSTRLRSAGGDLGTNYAAEDFYCGLLNIILEPTFPKICLKNLNAMKDNFPGVDLGDDRLGIAVQVTTTQNRGKINHTLDEFFENDLDKVFAERLIILVIGKKDDFKKEFAAQRGYKFNHPEDIWDTDHLGKEIAKLDLDGLKKLYAYLQETLDLIPAEERGLRLPLSAMDRAFFVGRKQELAALAEKVDDRRNNTPIFVTGLGGMGKTELVARFCADYDGGRSYFVRFRENFTQTVAVGVAGGIEGYAEREPDEVRDYTDAMARLRSCCPGDILVIDNADEPDGNFGNLQRDPAWKELRQLPLRLIITTRCELSGAIRVGNMDNDTLYRIFENQELSLDVSQMDALISAVNGHTMTVELIARTLKWSRTLSVEKLLVALRAGNLPEQRMRPVAMERNGEVEQERIYGHLRSLFNVAQLSEEVRDLLCSMVLLPESGLSMDIFESMLNEDGLELLESQIDHGWLGFDEDSRCVTIHPVVRLVCREELKPDDDNCGKYLNALWNQYDQKQYDAAKFWQLAELYSRAAEILPNRQGFWSLRAGYFWSQIGQAKKALQYELMTVRECEENAPDSAELATAYNNVGSTYGDLGDHKKALEYQQKDLVICEKVLPPDHPSLAISYGNVGSTYGDLGDHKQALEYKLKALTIHKNVLPPDHPDLAVSYNNVGSTYGKLGDPQKALKFHLKALAIRENILPPDHPDLAISYNNVGSIYGDLGDHKKELEYHLKAQVIKEKVLPPDHPSLAISYNNVGGTYGDLGDHKKALEYQLKALEIREKVLPPEHPDLAISYNNLSATYGELGNYEMELEYQLKALEIREKVLPPEHPDLSTSYNNLGIAYGNMGDFGKALEYLRRALAIREKLLPEGHPDTVSNRENVQILEMLLMLKELKEAGVDLSERLKDE